MLPPRLDCHESSLNPQLSKSFNNQSASYRTTQAQCGELKKCQTHNNENTCHLLIHQSESNQVLFTSGRSPQRSAMHRRSSEHEGVSMAPQAPCYLAPDLFLTIIEHKCIGTPCNCGLHASAT